MSGSYNLKEVIDRKLTHSYDKRYMLYMFMFYFFCFQSGKSKSSHKKTSQTGSQSRMSKFWGICRYILLFIIIPPFLNYASLHQEATHLQPDGKHCTCCSINLQVPFFLIFAFWKTCIISASLVSFYVWDYLVSLILFNLLHFMHLLHNQK